MAGALGFHLVGVGGAGMSPLAEALLGAGRAVSGSDRFADGGKALPVFEILRRQGARLFPQDGSGVRALEPGGAVVRSSAVEDGNADIAAARALGVPVLHRSAALAAALGSKRLIAIAGTSGKSTITGMLGAALSHAGLSPTVVCGAPVVDWASESRTGATMLGDSDIAVAEADESDRSLLNFSPWISLVSNSSPDHFPQAETDALFDAFLAKTSGARVDGRRALPEPPRIEPLGWGSAFSYGGAEFTLRIPGRHNALNAWQAARVAEVCGVPAAVSAAALAGFRGLKRRMEALGVSAGGVRVVDDYAHNTEKIRAALISLQAFSPRLCALWRPHGYGPLRAMSGDLERMFAEVLRPGDALVLPPVFDAGGTALRDVQSDALAARLSARGVDAVFVRSYDEALPAIRARACPLFVTLGARDPDLPLFARAALAAL